MHRLGVEDVGATFPHRVAYHPTCHSLRVTHVGDAPLRLLRHVRDARARRARRTPRSAAASAARSRVKNADTSSAMLADKCARPRAERRRVLHRPRRLVPAADRRRAVATRHAACGRSTSRRSSRRDDREHRAVPGSGAARARERAAAGEPARARPTRSARSARGSSPSCPTGRSCARRAARSRQTCSPASTSTCVQFEAAVTAAGGQVHWARDAAEANAVVADVARRARRDRGREGEVADDRRDRA